MMYALEKEEWALLALLFFTQFKSQQNFVLSNYYTTLAYNFLIILQAMKTINLKTIDFVERENKRIVPNTVGLWKYSYLLF